MEKNYIGANQAKLMRKEIRVLGIDDSPFGNKKGQNVLVIGTYYRGGNILDGVLSKKIRKDGNDSTIKLADSINKCKWKPTLRAILLDGIALGGFNVVDINKLYGLTDIPVIVVMRKSPNIEEMENTLKKIKQERKIRLIKKAGDIHKAGKVFIQFAGIAFKEAEEVIDITTTYADIPEPLRIAHIIAAGIVKGESKGRA